MEMKWSALVSIIVTSLMIFSALSIMGSPQSAGDGEGAERANSATYFSSDVEIYDATGVRYLGGDIFKGANYFYAYVDEYSVSGYSHLKRSVDGVTWPSGPGTTVFSGLDRQQGGFCVYTVGGTDHIIASTMGYVMRSTNNGNSFTSLASLGEDTTFSYNCPATNASMDPSRPYDGDIYVVGKRAVQGVYLWRSTDDGASWSVSTVASPETTYVALIRDGTKLYCFFSICTDVPNYLHYNEIYVANSTDWGKSWGSPTMMFSTSGVNAGVEHTQYIDEQKCLITISEVNVHSGDYSGSRGIYGYFWYGNKTFQQVGCETGPSYNNPDAHTYTGIAFNDEHGTNYTSVWCYSIVDKSYNAIRTHFSHDSGVSISSIDLPPPPDDVPDNMTNYSVVADSDLDGLDDEQELQNGTNPYNWDTDGDLLSDGFEIMVSHSDPKKNDTDSDGIDDFTEFVMENGYSGQIRTLPSGWVEMTIKLKNETIVIQTNSSVIEGKFDKEKAKLTVKVHGPAGTIGVAYIWIPKTMCDLSDIKIQFDGGTIDYNVTEHNSYYKIQIAYHHSEHELSAQFLEGAGDDAAAFSYYLPLIVIAYVSQLVIGAVVVIVIRRRKMS